MFLLAGSKVYYCKYVLKIEGWIILLLVRIRVRRCAFGYETGKGWGNRWGI